MTPLADYDAKVRVREVFDFKNKRSVWLLDDDTVMRSEDWYDGLPPFEIIELPEEYYEPPH